MGKATNSIARKGSRGDFVPFHFPLAGCRGGAPAGAWGNAPTVPRTTGMPNALNKGAGSEAFLPVTLRVRRRAPKLLFPQDSVKNPFFGADFLAKETHLICCISWMRCVLWIDFSMRICLCAAWERRGGGGDRRLRLFPLPPPRSRRSEIPA